MNKIKVFIVVLNWNRFEETRDCLNSLKKMIVPVDVELSVIVVDNNSQDGSIKKLQDLKIKDLNINFLENKENLGYAGGNNTGMCYALEHGAEWVTVLNNDTRVAEDLLQNLMEAGKKYKHVGIISPKIYFEKGFEYHKKYKKSELGKVIWYAGGKIDWDNVYGSNMGVDEVDMGQFEKVQEIDFATGACMFINAKALSDIGLFNESYFLYMEDDELSIRIKEAGYRIIYYPKGMLWHKVAQSSKIGSGLNDYFLSRNRMLFGMKYAKFRTKLALLRESVRLLKNGREWQKKGVRDYYLSRLGKGSWQ